MTPGDEKMATAGPTHWCHIDNTWTQVPVHFPPVDDTWVPAPMRWRHVQPGDVIVASDGQHWRVSEVWLGRRFQTATAWCGPERFSRHIHPEEVIDVLVPTPERDTVELVIEHLGAQLIERRTIAPLNK